MPHNYRSDKLNTPIQMNDAQLAKMMRTAVDAVITVNRSLELIAQVNIELLQSEDVDITPPAKVIFRQFLKKLSKQSLNELQYLARKTRLSGKSENLQVQCEQGFQHPQYEIYIQPLDENQVDRS